MSRGTCRAPIRNPGASSDTVPNCFTWYCEATVPKITIITRKAFGGAYCAMGSKYSRADLNWAWPSAQIAVMGPEGAVKILYQKELDLHSGSKFKEEVVKEYTEKFLNPFIAAERGIIHGVVMPKETRSQIIRALDSSFGKK